MANSSLIQMAEPSRRLAVVQPETEAACRAAWTAAASSPTHGHSAGRTAAWRSPATWLYAGGVVISQTLTAITAYPRLDAALAPIDALPKKSPNDPTALTERGELRFLSGDLPAAVEDFRAALAHQPPPEVLRRTKVQLFDALTELGKRDLKALEKYLGEYEKLGKELLKERAP